jgi:hypothetical protein
MVKHKLPLMAIETFCIYSVQHRYKGFCFNRIISHKLIFLQYHNDLKFPFF